MHMDKVVAIHQPNFFPWLGYFDKIALSDVFILFDDVQFHKTGGAWSNRVKLLVSGEAKWVTAAIARNYHGVRKINEMEFRADIPWREKMLKTIDANYRKSLYFDDMIAFLEPLIMNPENNIAEYNCHAIATFVDRLGLGQEKLIRSSFIDHTGVSTALLIDLTRRVDGSAYMCGGGADGYQQDELFRAAGINLIYQGFVHPEYPQQKADIFFAGLSIIDVLFQIGIDATSKLLLKRKLAMRLV